MSSALPRRRPLDKRPLYFYLVFTLPKYFYGSAMLYAYVCMCAYNSGPDQTDVISSFHWSAESTRREGGVVGQSAPTELSALSRRRSRSQLLRAAPALLPVWCHRVTEAPTPVWGCAALHSSRLGCREGLLESRHTGRFATNTISLDFPPGRGPPSKLEQSGKLNPGYQRHTSKHLPNSEL